MESYQPFSPSFKSSPVMAEPEKPKMPELIKPDSENKTTETVTSETHEGYIGFLDVFIHEARDIHNICIYHKQDVYAKLCLTTDPESAASTQIINGGGRNPVFNQSLRLNVKTVDSSLKCEIWMLSRVKNYLEDQLLGFALVPLSDVVVADGKLVQEFSLSSTDLFHSPAGFVQLSISYTGSSPDVLAITPRSKASSVPENDDSITGECELDKIEFPDLKIVNENKMMVSEYLGIPCTNMDSESAEELVSAENENCPDNEAGIRVVESFAAANSPDSVGVLKNDTPPSSVSTNESPSEKDKSTEAEIESSVGTTDNAFAPPVISINMEPEQSVVQQDIVDMYMKSMQQFTESLANMKLPMDLETNNSSSTTTSSSSNTENGGSGSAKKLQESKKTGSRVFYGSRAFF